MLEECLDRQQGKGINRLDFGIGGLDFIYSEYLKKVMGY